MSHYSELKASLHARRREIEAIQPPATPQEPICGTCGKPSSDGDTYVQCGPCHWASTPSPEGQTWQPIETAPKDGTPVLLFAEASIQHDSAPKPFVHVSRWVRETREWWEPKSAWKMRLVVEDASHWESWEIPTRWMPLPSPPTPEGTQP